MLSTQIVLDEIQGGGLQYPQNCRLTPRALVFLGAALNWPSILRAAVWCGVRLLCRMWRGLRLGGAGRLLAGP
jgi:hypothetical protein